jgi:SAM-dependent methyltransferase
MLKRFLDKNPGCVTHHRSMTHLQGLGDYDVIVCFGDSVNYLIDDADLDALFAQVDAHLKPGGCFLFDVHTEARLVEFDHEYIEEGFLGQIGYQWTIQTMPNQMIDHALTLYDALGSFTQHQIIQRVYSLKDIKERLKRFNWATTVYSDFQVGCDPNAEKYLLVCRKENT